MLHQCIVETLLSRLIAEDFSFFPVYLHVDLPGEFPVDPVDVRAFPDEPSDQSVAVLAAAQLEKIQFAHRKEHEGKEMKVVNLTLVKMISFTLTSPMKAVNAFSAMP